ncbi:MAG: hypothetical protein PHS54_00340 [Clostridia bacterium]|nr:hypothetical protein [Clostridia bacterium]
MLNFKYFDTIYDMVTHFITEGVNTQNFIDSIRYSLYKDPQTVYFGFILQNMTIVVINDNNVDYSDPSPTAYRDPIWLRVYCGGQYNPREWQHKPTMAVDIAGNLYVGEQYLDDIFHEFNEDSKVFVEVVKSILIHESMHISEMTFFREQGRFHEAWNIATDAYINYWIVNNGRPMPANLILPDKDGNITLQIDQTPPLTIKYNVLGKSAELLYEDIMGLYKDNKPSEPGNTPPVVLQKGDPVYDPVRKEYGVILDVNGPKIRVITEEEAMIRSKLKKRGIVSI